MTIRARVFAKDGNRFLVPGYWCDEDDENWPGMSITSIICDGMLLGMVNGFDSHQEWLDVEVNADGVGSLTNVPCKMVGKNLTFDVLLISGPLFNEGTCGSRRRGHICARASSHRWHEAGAMSWVLVFHLLGTGAPLAVSIPMPSEYLCVATKAEFIEVFIQRNIQSILICRHEERRGQADE